MGPCVPAYEHSHHGEVDLSGHSGAPTARSEWVVDFCVTRTNRRAVESLTALSDGRVGTRGLISRHVDPARPSTVAAGIYDSDTNPALLPGPRWTAFTLHEGEEFGTDAQLDLHRGVLTSWSSGEAGTARTVEFASIVRPGVHVIRVDGPAVAIAHGRACLLYTSDAADDN